MTFRGSRKHILDWTGIPSERFAQELTDLVSGSGVHVSTNDYWMPRGHQAMNEAKLDAPGIPFLTTEQKDRLRSWWLKHVMGANVPNWDLVSTCTTSDQRRGLILIEAKAHYNELKREGKPLAKDASAHSKENHERIGQAIADASNQLCDVITGVNICRDRHYQLANRVATSWFLASELGIPTVLVYLGFHGDTDIADQGKPFFGDADWQQAFRDHAEGILPDNFYDRPLVCSGTPMWLFVRSRPTMTGVSRNETFYQFFDPQLIGKP